jgi:hypothetical protein
MIVGVSSNGRRHALSVSRISAAPPPTNTIVSGEIEEVTEDHIVIAGQSIPITQETFMKVRPKKGAKVRVRIDNTQTGAVAGSISAAGQATQAASSTFTMVGLLETDLGQETREFVVSGQTFAITADTSFDFTAGAAGDGTRVKVEGGMAGDDTLEARSLTVLAADQSDDVYMIGVFEGSRPGVWVIGGLALDSPGGNAAEPAPGSLLAVDAEESDGVLRVSSFFTIQAPDQALFRLEGTATSIEDSVWKFGYGQVRVDSTSEVSGKPVAGARAIVWGNKDQAGAIDAVYVRVLDERTVVPPAPEQDDADDDDDADD